MQLIIDTTQIGEPMGDLYGVFFEDLNHAADGGLYAELIRNRAFEFDPVDNAAYNHLTGWERIGREEDIRLSIQTGGAVNEKNPHYLSMDILNPGKGAGVQNAGFHDGIYMKQGASFDFSCWAKREQDLTEPVHISLRDGGRILAQQDIFPNTRWEKYELAFTVREETQSGRLAITAEGRGKVYLDFVSLFPTDTWKGRKGGLRRDLAELLEAMQPKFLRFPGGCLTHDGALDPDARDAQYRWKNTLGPVEGRPARRNNWGYNQTLGLGFYELFQFCNEIGAKPLPVISPGYDPHHHREAPPEQMQYFIDEALDLIEFANGGADTRWGSVRAQMGHKEPFHLEYLGIGNEEVGEPFFDRYRIVAEAVRARYPDIKLIGTSGPFAAGGEYERGWKHAREDKADLVDEHYYQSPEWFLANHSRYDGFDPAGPKVFLGEYASWGNTFYHALCEASFMIGLERNKKAVGLACYAPMLCNADYVNWKPDMIWFNGRESFGTANYYVQKLFMENQGGHTLSAKLEDTPPDTVLTGQPDRLCGRITLDGDDSAVTYRNIVFVNDDTGEETALLDVSVACGGGPVSLCETDRVNYTLRLSAVETEGAKGFRIGFAGKDDKNGLCWSIGGWQNQDTILTETIDGRNSDLCQYLMSVERGKEYGLTLQVRGRVVRTFIDGAAYHDITVKPVTVKPLYTAAAIEENGDILIKAVNVSEKGAAAGLVLRGLAQERHSLEVTTMGGFAPTAENSFEQPALVAPETETAEITGNTAEWVFAPRSITFLRIKNNQEKQKGDKACENS